MRAACHGLITAPVVAPPPPADGPAEEEELEDVPLDQKIKDKLYGASIKRQIGGVSFTGRVEDIEAGLISKERLYRIRYSDGDVEHFTAEQVREFADTGWRQIPGNPFGKFPPDVDRKIPVALDGLQAGWRGPHYRWCEPAQQGGRRGRRSCRPVPLRGDLRGPLLEKPLLPILLRSKEV